MGKTLIYSQDLGSVNWIIPILRKIAKHDFLMIAHNLSYSRMLEQFSDTKKLDHYFPDQNIQISDWQRFIQKENIKRVFCSTSSRYKDLSNSNLIIASRLEGIKTLSIMDHWKGYDRFFSIDNESYMSDEILCIDSNSKKRLKDIGFPEKAIHIVGHPGLEFITENSHINNTFTNCLRILIISQVFFDGEKLRSLFLNSRGESRLLRDIILTSKNVVKKNYSLSYRPHPKEDPPKKILENIILDNSEHWKYSLQKHDIFIGYNSMALIEAQLSGKICVCLDYKEFDGSDDNHLPFKFPITVDNHEALARELESIDNNFKEYKRYPVYQDFEKFSGSIDKASQVVVDFLKG